MEEFDIREATPKDAEKIIAYLAQVGGETDYLSFGKEGLPISIEEEEKFIQNINKEEHSVLYVVWENGEIIGGATAPDSESLWSSRNGGRELVVRCYRNALCMLKNMR